MLNHLKFLLIAVAITTHFFSYSQEGSKELEQIKLSIQAGNAQVLSDKFASMLEVKMDNEEASYSRNQALFVVKDFFRKHPPKSFQYNHRGNSPGGSIYVIGTYKSLRREYRVYIKLKKASGDFFIDTLEFTPGK